MRARRPAAALAALAASVLAGGCLPTPATVEARRTTELYTTFVAVAAVVAVIVIGLSVFAILRYRARGDDELPRQVIGNTRLEAVWTAIPLLTVAALFGLTVLVLNGFDDATRAAATVDIRVTAYRWGWQFEYPADGVRVEGLRSPGPEAYVPVGENVHVSLTGIDVIHSFFVPQFLFKRDAIPGRINEFAFTVDTPGRYRGQCAEFCGLYHSQMPFTIVAVTRPEYEAWLAANRGGANGSPGAGGSPASSASTAPSGSAAPSASAAAPASPASSAPPTTSASPEASQ
jgi:cytochrome c oxidase subunit 2